MSARATGRVPAHQATNLHGKSISASDCVPSPLTNLQRKHLDTRVAHSCKWTCRRNEAPQPGRKATEPDRLSPTLHWMGPRRFLLLFCRTRAFLARAFPPVHVTHR